MKPYRLLDLFSGIGGFSLGLERSGGFKTVAFCEIDPFCRKVLRKHWPDVPQYEDVRSLTAERLAADGISVDAICGGFPCQDISTAGKGAGLDGARSGLWSEYARIIGELRPAYVIVENVAALLGRGLDRVLGDLAALGYDAEWHCIPASAVGAPHRRDRIWIVANACGGRRCGSNRGEIQQPRRTEIVRSSETVSDSYQGLYPRELVHGANSGTTSGSESGNAGEGKASHRKRFWVEPGAGRPSLADTDSTRHQGPRCELSRGWGEFASSYLAGNRQWAPEPGICRVADGISDWSHRVKSLGNAVVPQIPELIGRAILASTEAMSA